MLGKGKKEKAPNTDSGYRMSRRAFLKVASSAAVLTGVAGVTGSCSIGGYAGRVVWDDSPFDGFIPSQVFAYADVVPPPPSVILDDMLSFFTVQEARTVEALTATIMPGTPDDPGAREAKVMTFIDTELSRADMAFWQPTYLEPPFPETYEGPEPPANATPYRRIFVPQELIDRYGFQSRLSKREIYRMGIAALNQYSMQRFGAVFPDLADDQQEAIVGALADGNVEAFSEPSAELFFETARQDTIFGMFADPAYGGNQDMVGWRLVGYPGVHRAYTPADMLREQDLKPLQTLNGLSPFNPGVGEDGSVVFPVSDANPANQMVPDVPHHLLPPNHPHP